jgi:hypothetical protein
MPPGSLHCGLHIALPRLELGLQLCPQGGIAPLLAYLPPGEKHPIAELITPAHAGGGQEVQQIPPQVRQPQGLRGIEADNNHPNAHAGNQSETPSTRKAIYALSQAV